MKHNHVDGVETPAVGVKVRHDLQHSYLRVEGVGMFEVVDPKIVHHFPKESCHPTFCRFVTGIVVNKGFVGGFSLHSRNWGCVVRDGGVVEWETSWSHERNVAMVGFVRCSLGAETCERMDSAN